VITSNINKDGLFTRLINNLRLTPVQPFIPVELQINFVSSF